MSDLPEVIAAYIAAYNRMDVAGMVACLSDDVAFRNIVDGDVTMETSGKQAFSDLASAGVQAFKSRQQTVTNMITVGTVTLVEIDYSAVVSADLPNGWKAGQQLRFRGASAFRVEDGRIVSITDQS
ncbi:nuclear transport factor 2 family protein [Ruegeria sp. R13_0]|uniref:nuclear transport factor 2 family protein n=1 Tax=Ruegeria sp. R13_0 TaxID=2821099 RepID=UPI001ADB1FBE|nr:nuclear transport factor 2 family protein [Ruegeria sp. R13_0]MBO9436374.1 nuclear transport factor 2 family protein [Ruegeria sp. R13_0]